MNTCQVGSVSIVSESYTRGQGSIPSATVFFFYQSAQSWQLCQNKVPETPSNSIFPNFHLESSWIPLIIFNSMNNVYVCLWKQNNFILILKQKYYAMDNV